MMLRIRVCTEAKWMGDNGDAMQYQVKLDPAASDMMVVGTGARHASIADIGAGDVLRRSHVLQVWDK